MIRPLPPELRGLLARGEVLLTVKDAVRELLENALDAGARRVRVELWGGGLKRLVVEDDGEGIPLEDLPLAVEPYATSKLQDLEGIRTLGFRGQALYALRQAARLRIRSRPRGQLGGGLLLAEGERVEVRPVPAPPGTRVEVEGLFLGEGRDPKGEVRGVLELLKRYLLRHPRLALALEAHLRPVLDPGRELDADVAFLQLAARTPARRARRLDHLALAAAPRARLLHLHEAEGDLPDLSRAAAGAAVFFSAAAGGAAAGAGLAGDEPFVIDVALAAVGGFFERDGHAVAQVATTLRAITTPPPTAATAKKLIKDAATSSAT